ncbi:MAG: hypothetical protein AAGC60_11465 [Acidobacteriota bacterium]
MLLGVLLTASVACRDADSAPDGLSERSGGPIVLISLGALRPADVEHMPALRGFAQGADWSGRAVAPSSSPVVSAATLLTGVDPWVHGVLAFDDLRDPLGAPTLAQELGALGYFTEAHLPASSGLARYGLLAGFDVVDASEDSRGAVAQLARVDDAPRLLWIHLAAVGFPLRDRRGDIPTLPEPPRSRVDLLELFPSSDPEVALDEMLHRATEALWRHEVAVVDRRLEQLFAALERSGWRHRALVVVTALHGLELGEHGQSLYGWNLGRAAIEVPLIVDLPDGAPSLGLPAGLPVARQRVASTLVEAAGATPSPAHLAPLTRVDDTPILSSLYLRDGVNTFALVVAGASPDAGSAQLLREARFAPAEAEYWPAVRARAGETLALGESPARIFERLRRAFRHTPPFEGPLGIGQRLERWRAEGGVETVDDPALQAELAQALQERWRRAASNGQTPEEARRRSALRPPNGYTQPSEEPHDKPSGP